MMNTLLVGALIITALALGWLAWCYFVLRRKLDEFSRRIEHAAAGDFAPGSLPTDIHNLEQVSNAVHTLVMSFDHRLASLDAERARLEATLTQMTDGVLIVDAQGRIQMSNPAAEPAVPGAFGE